MAGKAQGQIDALSALAANSITALTGDVSATGPGSVAATISNNAVTFAKMQQIAQGFMGRSSVGTGTGELLTPTQATALLNTFSASLKGLVPSSIVADGTKVLYDDGTWAVPPASGSGSVTNVSGAGIASLFSLSITNPSTTPALAFALIAQSANRIFAGPTSGAAAAPTWRVLAVSDIPELPISQISGLQGELDSYLPDALATDMLFIGNVSDVAVNAIVTGDLTAAYVDNSGTNEAEFTIANEAVTYAKIQNVTSQTLLGRFALTDGVVQQLTLNGTDFTINSSTGVIGLATPNSPILTTKGDILTHTGAAQVRLGIGANATFFMADTAATTGNKWVAMSGDATIAVSGALTIAAGAVTLAKMANMATNSFIGRISASTGVPEILTATQATSLLNLFSSSAKGLVPVVTGPAVGDVTYFLNATGTWTVPAGGGGGSGTVSSGTQYQLAYYAANGTTVSGLTLITASRALVSDANGLPIASTVSTTQLQYLASATGTTGTTSTNLVFSTSPTLVTPTLGAALATSINGLTITSTTGTLTLDSGSTLATSGAFSTTLTATATTTLTLPTTGTLATLAGTETFTNKTLNGPKIGSTGGQGHFHMHSTNSVPTGLTDYITVFGDKGPNKKVGFLFETDGFESYFQFNATSTDKTYTFPDLSGTVALNPMTALGDIIYGGTVTSGVADPTRLAGQTTNGIYLLRANVTASAAVAPDWLGSTGSGNVVLATSPTIVTPTVTGIATFGNGTSAGEIRLLEPSGDGINYVALKSQATTADYSITLPPAAPSGAQYLQSTGSGGVLQWASGTTTGVSSVGTFSGSAQTNGASIAGSVITFGPASDTVPGMISTGAQTIGGGIKTFNLPASSGSAVTFSGAGSATNAQLLFTPTTSWINFNGNGGALPTLTTRSSGTRIVLFPFVSSSNLDWAIGYHQGPGALWLSSPATIEFYASSGGGSGTPLPSGNFQYTSSVRGLNLNAATDANATIPQLLISGATASWMSFGTVGGGNPTLTNRSVGTRIVLRPFVSASTLDWALGWTSGPGALWLTSPAGIDFYTNSSTTVRATIDTSGLTLAANCSVLMATTGTGGMIGTTTSQLVGFHGTAGTIQRASAAQAAVATTAATLVTPYGYTTAAQADGIITLLNEIRTVLVNKGLMKGSA
jgi:hypothetical protein